MTYPYHYDDNEMVTILEKVFRDFDRDYRWDMAEQDVARPCPDCDPGHRAWCDVHRCRETTARGTRCKRRIGDDLLHCGHHNEKESV